MLIAPILTYFITLQTIFRDQPTYSALAAVVVTNAIIAIYVVVAWLEPSNEATKSD